MVIASYCVPKRVRGGGFDFEALEAGVKTTETLNTTETLRSTEILRTNEPLVYYMSSELIE